MRISNLEERHECNAIGKAALRLRAGRSLARVEPLPNPRRVGLLDFHVVCRSDTGTELRKAIAALQFLRSRHMANHCWRTHRFMGSAERKKLSNICGPDNVLGGRQPMASSFVAASQSAALQ